ncbi:MAG: MOSC domain-containing protein [Acidobacteria bacterium]|nr:MOSC domain-containing protein [Acidobacteriota bacterium]
MRGPRGRLEAIWIKRVRRGPMDAVARASLHAGRGLAGNADQGGRRQVTIIDRQAWDGVIEALGGEVDPAVRRANLLVSGVRLAESRGRVLRVGGCRLRINGETRPCALMDEARPGLRRALDPPWRGGVFAEVLDEGQIEVGAAVEWADTADTKE